FKIDSKRQFIQVLPFQERRGIDWLIVVVVPEEDFMSEINANTRTTIILCIVALIIAIIVGLLIVNSINKAVIILKESALALAQGEWEKRIEIKRTDELGELARAFNSMADQLADYNSILEQQVAKRTLELQQEIAERKQAEQALVESETRFRLLAEATFEAIVITQKGVILDANQTCAEMFGYELSEVIGMQVMDFAAPECREQVMQKILSGDEGIYETICLCKDGTTFPAEIRARVMSYRGRTIRMAAIQDITSRKRGEEATVLAERNRLAQEIHDTLAQAFAVVIVHLDTASRKLTTNIETAQALIKAGRDLAHSGLTEARRSIKAMRSQLLEDENIFNGLNRFATQMFSPTNTRIVCQAVGKIYSLPPDVENNLLRIGQEALTNAFKYAKAQEIRIELAYWEKQFSLRIQDDGQGFDMGSVSIVNSFGLLIMSERAERIGAKLTIQSSPRQGTEVIVTVNI
ncbi:PAS domain S-box protein, partial [Nostoc sp. NIES-2111]